MEENRISILIEKFIEGSISKEEELELMEWYNDVCNQDVIWPEKQQGSESVKREMLEAIYGKTRQVKGPVVSMFKYWVKIAGVVIFVLGMALGGYYWAVHRKVSGVLTENKPVPQDIAPGKSGAVLLLSDGKQVQLSGLQQGSANSAALGLFQKRGDSSIIFNGNATPISSDKDLAQNILYVPEGHKFQITLADETKVWLNAGSKLKFPSEFNGKTRTVELEGEGYFAVKHNVKQPFEVITKNQVVRDIGTEFNIRAYKDEVKVKTTLVNGIVDVSLKGCLSATRLKPGEQAVVGSDINVGLVDLASVTGWKEDQFIFHSEPLKEIMTQIARWYNVEVVYKQDVSNKSVWGTVSRNTPISEVLNMIELTGVAHFKIVENRILVYK